jgi:hypothetical protein
LHSHRKKLHTRLPRSTLDMGRHGSYEVRRCSPPLNLDHLFGCFWTFSCRGFWPSASIAKAEYLRTAMKQEYNVSHTVVITTPHFLSVPRISLLYVQMRQLIPRPPLLAILTAQVKQVPVPLLTTACCPFSAHQALATNSPSSQVALMISTP